MKIYDISMSIHHDMPVYKNQPEKKPMLKFTTDYVSGKSCESQIQMNVHTGTHVDAPLHMLENGASIEQIELKKVITQCKVFDFTQLPGNINREALESKDIKAGDFILLKTKNSYVEHFDLGFVFLEKSGAVYLRDQSVIGVGIDALGIERNQPDHDTHKILFQASIIIVEGLRLKGIKEGRYLLFAAPLKIKSAEGAPARAVLVEEAGE